MPKKGYTYILTNKNQTVLYTGVTSNLLQRMQPVSYTHLDVYKRQPFHTTKQPVNE